MRDGINSHISSLYRWGVILDSNNVSSSIDVRYIDRCLDAIQYYIQHNKIRLDYKPIFYSLKHNVPVMSNDVRVKESYEKTYFIKYRCTNEYNDSRDIPINKLYNNLTFIVECNQPYILVGIQSISIHSNMSYSVIYYNDVPYVMCSKYVDKYKSSIFAHGKVKIVGQYTGSQLSGLRVIDPLTHNEIEVIDIEYDEDRITHVSPVSPSMIPYDFVISEKKGLNRQSYVSTDGRCISTNANINSTLIHHTTNDAVLLELSAHGDVFNHTEHSLCKVYYRTHNDSDDILYMMYVYS